MYQTVAKLLDDGVDPYSLWWLRLDHPLYLRADLGRLIEPILATGRFSQANPAFVFLDELVYARDWDLWLKTFYDEHYPLRIVATSSATAALRERRLESGIGRWEEQFLGPYLISEYLDVIDVELEVELAPTLAGSIDLALGTHQRQPKLSDHRRRFMLTGGFPELLIGSYATAEQDETTRLLTSQRILRSDAIERAVYKDIPQSFGVDNPMMLERLLYILAGQMAGLLSPTRICRELDGLSQPTFDKYLSYLERAFLVFTLPNYSGREASVQKRGRKLYFVDGAVRNAALQRGLAPLENLTELGLLQENLVASHLHALALQSQVRLFHWRDGRHEVDLVYDHPERSLAFEVGASVDHSRSGLLALADRYERFRDGLYLVASDATPLPASRTKSGVGTIPLDLFLAVVARQAEAGLEARLGAV